MERPNKLLICWSCEREITELSLPLAFRAICPHCSTYLHCCKNCNHYHPGMPNDCKIPGTEPVRDRESLNFCEEFSWRYHGSIAKQNSSDPWNKLFRDS